MHQRDAVAALGFIHEVSRNENRDVFPAGEFDQNPPKTVPCHRIDAGGRLVEDQHLRLMDQRHRKREPLAPTQWEIAGKHVGHGG